ncbi:hypothetical protein CHS0354_012607 [Potamilus streckersoni]|uniref:Uncharacterized protein n=1 Tax=Potamilus streckersoni TaxID=2493646 RepID=A0AAE0SXC9_9BIVA|nr:hypothetical protein CHS0354_012607 [Potamilus streckersoni]
MYIHCCLLTGTGLKLLDVLNFMRREEPDQNLIMQLEVFHERKIADEEAINIEHNVDLNSPQDIIDQIQNRAFGSAMHMSGVYFILIAFLQAFGSAMHMSGVYFILIAFLQAFGSVMHLSGVYFILIAFLQVFGSAKMACLVNILQDLLAVETVYPNNSEYLWQTLDCLVHHIVHTCDVARLDDIQSDLQKLPDQVHLGLKCVHSYRQLGDSGVSGCSANSNCCQNHSNVSQKKTSACQNQWNIGQTKSYVGQKHCNEKQCMSDIFENCQESSTVMSCIHRNDLSKDKTVQRLSPSEHEKPQSELKLSQNISPSSQNESKSRQLDPMKAKSSQDRCSAVNITMSNIVKEKPVYNHNNSFSHLSITSYDNVSVNDPGLVGYQSTLKFKTEPKIVDYTMYDNIDYIDTGMDEDIESLAVEKQSNVVVRQPVPAPVSKMQDLKWIILSEDKIAGQYKCLWQTMAANGHGLIPDFHRLEALFQVNTTDTPIEEVEYTIFHIIYAPTMQFEL